MAMFEAAIYNRIVRELVADHQHHEHLDDVWSELNFIEVEAKDESDARNKLLRRYPDKQGYEITQVIAFLE